MYLGNDKEKISQDYIRSASQEYFSVVEFKIQTYLQKLLNYL